MPGNPVTIDMVTTPKLGVRHGFIGRRGGVSAGIFGSLNVGLGSADDGNLVRENRRRAVEAVAPGAHLVTLHQVHSNIVVPVTAADRPRPPSAQLRLQSVR